MRLMTLLAAGVSLAASSSLAAQNDAVLTGPEPEWATPSELAPVPADASGAVFVRKQDTLIRLSGEGEATYTAQQVKILNSQALEIGNIGLTWNPAVGAPTVHALRIHRDGEVIDVLANNRFEVLRREDQLEQAMLDGLLTAVLRVPDLRVGDELEWSYSIPSHDATLGDDSFGALSLSNSPPSGRFRLGLSWTDGQEPKMRLSPEFESVAQRAPGMLDLRFDDPKIVNPPKGAPPRYFWLRVAEYSDFASWPAVSQRFHPLFAQASTLAADSPLHAEAARIAAAHEGKLARAQAALELVQQQVRYIYVGLNGGNFVPAGADETWSRRYGDCKGKTALLLALLRELGIEAEAVLVNNTGLDDGFGERLPNPALFDHVVVRARIDGKAYWLDGTLPDVARADVTPFVPYRSVLPLAAKGSPLEAIARQPASVPDKMQLYEIDARDGFDAPARIVQTTIQRGIKGLSEYVQFSAVSRDQLANAFRSNLTGQSTWNAIDTVDYRYDAKSRASILTISGTGPVDWDDDGDGARSLSLPGGGFYPPERLQRAGDQDQSAPFYDGAEYTCYVTTLRVPSDTQLDNWRVNRSIDTMLYGRVYYRAWDRRDGTIRMVRGARTEEPEISPARAQRDNGRVADFDNSMAWAYFTPEKTTPFAGAPGALPASWEPAWTSSAPPCLPSDLAG